MANDASILPILKTNTTPARLRLTIGGQSAWVNVATLKREVDAALNAVVADEVTIQGFDDPNATIPQT